VQPVDIDWDPDGGLWVAAKSGGVYVHRHGRTTLAATLAVESTGDAGIGAITVDPGHAGNGYVWIQYTTPAENRISRFSAVNDTLVDEVVVFQHAQLSTAYNGGCLLFHPDGTLFVSTGMDGAAGEAQDPHRIRGKLLRLLPDGSAAPDNPYADGVGGDPRVYASGLREVFRCALQPGTHEVFLADVGDSDWEEINIAVAGADYGYPTAKGPDPPGLPIEYPLHAYAHEGAFSAVIGGDFAPAGGFPAVFTGDYFFGDFSRSKLYRMRLGPQNTLLSVQEWATQVFAPTTIEFGPDGALYYVSYYAGEIRRIAYAGGPGSGGRVSGLTVAKAPQGQLTLSWNPSCLTGDTDYAVYEGIVPEFATWSDEACSTAGRTTRTIAPDPRDTFYLVVPNDGIRQGSFGQTSAGVERIPPALLCYDRIVSACP
jgi:glucose/arabinose dehydrogenase